MAANAYPESSPGPEYRARCCGSMLQSLHRYHVVRCQCGRCSVDGGADAPRLTCHAGDTSDWLEPLTPALSAAGSKPRL